jgi:hypothetical protein
MTCGLRCGSRALFCLNRQHCVPALIHGNVLAMKSTRWLRIPGTHSSSKIVALLAGSDASKSRATMAEALGASATATAALGALAVGGLAIGFFVIGRLIVRELLVKRIHVGHLKIDQLDVEDLRVSKLTVLQDQRGLDGSVHQSNEPSP